MCGITTWCQGWNAFGNSFGRTSTPQVSDATPAISLRWIQSIVRNERPGASPPAYWPQPGPQVEPRYTGQVVWRAMVPRLHWFPRLAMFYGPRNKAGVNPVSHDEMYLFLVQNVDRPDRPPREKLPDLLREQLSDYTGLVAELREHITDPELVNYRPIHMLLMPRPWFSGAVVLIGDSVHSTTPHLAMGAGPAIEDPWGKLVVDHSTQLGEWEKTRDDADADPAGLSARSWAALAEPA